MKFFILFIALFVSLKADFTISYQLDNGIIQEADYKNSNNVLFIITQNGKEIEKLIIYNGKKYLTFKENGIEQIFEISDKISQPVDENAKIKKPEYTIVKKDTNLTIADFKAERWYVKYKDSNKSVELVVSNDPRIVKAIKSITQALRKLLPKDRQQDVSIFNIGNGYVILEAGNLKFLTYKEDVLPEKLFAIDDDSLSPKEEEQLNENINKCFNSVCCGKKYSDSKELKTFLNSNIDKWQLKKIVKCEDPKEKGLESAIYSDAKHSIIIEKTSNTEEYGKIATFESQGIKMDNIHTQIIEGFKFTSAYIPDINASVADINLPASIISIYCKGKRDLSSFVKKAIKLKLKQSYSSSI